jgi:hypothetical protein
MNDMCRSLKDAVKRFPFSLLLGFTVTACSSSTPATSKPMPQPAPGALGVTFVPPAAGIQIHVDGTSCTTDAHGVAFCFPVPAGEHRLTFDGLEPAQYELVSDQVMANVSAGHNAEVVVRLRAKVPPLGRISVSGTHFIRDGQPFDWAGASAFQLVQLVANGRQADAEAFIAFAAQRGLNVLRVFTTTKYMFGLSPAAGVAALPETLALAHKHGLYLEVVGIADSCGPNPGERPCPEQQPYFDAPAHIAALGQACLADTACLGVEIANEPKNPTQARVVREVAYLESLRRLVPAPVLTTLGAADGSDDGSMEYTGGNYVVVHSDRMDGDDGWRWVRHAREMQNIRDTTHKPVVNDEPNRVNDIDKNFGVALICRLYGLGDTIHLGSLRYAQRPTGNELAAFEARVRAWKLFPPGFSGSYSRATLTGDPVTSISDTHVLRSYSGLAGNLGFVAFVGVKPGGEASASWATGWAHERVASEGGAVLFRVTR